MDMNWNPVQDNEKIKKEFLGYRDGLVQSAEGNWTMLPTTAKLVPTIMDMEVRDDDVWVVTYPKCGTTWTQEMVWQIANKVDLEGGKVDLFQRFPFLEFDSLVDIPQALPGIKGQFVSMLFNTSLWWSSIKMFSPSSWFGYSSFTEQLGEKDRSERRFIKSHLPMSLLPKTLLKKGKVIYVARNPRDVVVSYYHHHKFFKGHGYVGDLPNFAKRFMENQVMMGPYFPHIEEGWELKNHPNFLFIFYEDMKKDLRSVILKVCDFLESPLSETQITTLIDHLDIKNFRNNPAVNNEGFKATGLADKSGNFIRKGEVGGWKKEFEDFPEMEEEFNSWIEKMMSNSKVTFPDSNK